jgi:hypothetical protein
LNPILSSAKKLKVVFANHSLCRFLIKAVGVYSWLNSVKMPQR